MKTKTVVKTYQGSHESAMAQFRKDAEKMAADGYRPITQDYTPGSWGCGWFLFALLLCFILIGVLVFVYMIIVKPDGALAVTYELRDTRVDGGDAGGTEDSKVCPRCAETVKKAAKVCRYCGCEFKD